LQKIDSISLVLQMAPGYKELYKYYLMLLKGLSLNGDIFRLSIKELWQLYEYWTFLKLNSLLQDKYKLVKNNIIDLDYSGINVTLSQGASAEVEYQNPITGEKFTLSYNTSSGDGITTNQKPDNILSLSKNDSEHQYKFIFDAKYRLNNAEEGTRYGEKYDQIPGPEESDINTMHRYRDAVAAEMGEDYRRTMVGAYVLFPYHDKEKRFKEHKFYQSIDRVNIGAFPFLPGSTELLADFLENIIDESAQSNFKRNLLPAAADEFRPEVEFKVDLLLGSLSSKKQLQYLLDNNLYYLPLKQSVLNYNLEYIAIFQSKRKFGEESGVRYYGRIKNRKIVKRETIDFPSSSRKTDRNYLLFEVESWQQLGKKIKSEGYGVSGSHIYSNLMLLKKADTLPELSIRSLKEWRLWLELKRLKKEIRLNLENNNLDQNQEIAGFKVGEVEIKFKSNKLIAEMKDEQFEFFQSEFLQNPRAVLNKIMGLFEAEENS
ncbi:nuclease domain-containing protein, partial [Halanaerobium sp.]|uniref:nuclease domain-containing protein n=1 Tax=Halanaerobium sp. TaxID=1895664 RepID=UPI000DE75EC7